MKKLLLVLAFCALLPLSGMASATTVSAWSDGNTIWGKTVKSAYTMPNNPTIHSQRAYARLSKNGSVVVSYQGGFAPGNASTTVSAVFSGGNWDIFGIGDVWCAVILGIIDINNNIQYFSAGVSTVRVRKVAGTTTNNFNPSCNCYYETSFFYNDCNPNVKCSSGLGVYITGAGILPNCYGVWKRFLNVGGNVTCFGEPVHPLPTADPGCTYACTETTLIPQEGLYG